jgi:hypothetical protein
MGLRFHVSWATFGDCSGATPRHTTGQVNPLKPRFRSDHLDFPTPGFSAGSVHQLYNMPHASGGSVNVRDGRPAGTHIKDNFPRRFPGSSAMAALVRIPNPGQIHLPDTVHITQCMIAIPGTADSAHTAGCAMPDLSRRHEASRLPADSMLHGKRPCFSILVIRRRCVCTVSPPSRQPAAQPLQDPASHKSAVGKLSTSTPGFSRTLDSALISRHIALSSSTPGGKSELDFEPRLVCPSSWGASVELHCLAKRDIFLIAPRYGSTGSRRMIHTLASGSQRILPPSSVAGQISPRYHNSVWPVPSRGCVTQPKYNLPN